MYQSKATIFSKNHYKLKGMILCSNIWHVMMKTAETLYDDPKFYCCVPIKSHYFFQNLSLCFNCLFLILIFQWLKMSIVFSQFCIQLIFLCLTKSKENHIWGISDYVFPFNVNQKEKKCYSLFWVFYKQLHHVFHIFV